MGFVRQHQFRFGDAALKFVSNLFPLSAPPEVIERLNSLFEEKPFLSLYEKSQGEELKGDLIHSNFRIFCTANVGRVQSNKISAAMLNRCIRIWLPPLDEGIDAAMDESDEIRLLQSHSLFQLLRHRLSGISGSTEIAVLCLMFHRRVRSMINSKHLNLMAGFQLTSRTLLRAVDSLVYRLSRTSKDLSPATATCWALTRSYSAIVEAAEDTEKILVVLKDLMTVKFLDKTQYLRYFSPEEYEEEWSKSAKQDLAPHMRNIEVNIVNLLFALGFLSLKGGKMNDINLVTTLDFTLKFLETLLVPMSGARSCYADLVDEASRIQRSGEAISVPDVLNIFVRILQRAEVDKNLSHAGVLVGFDPGREDFFNFDSVIKWRNSVVEACDELSKNVLLYVRSAAVIDAANRKNMLARLFAVVSAIIVVCNHPLAMSASRLQKEMENVRKAIYLLKKHSIVVNWLGKLVDTTDPLLPEVNVAAEECKSRGAAWAYDHERSKPVISARTSLRRLAVVLLNQGASPISIKRFQMATEWSSLVMQCDIVQPRCLWLNESGPNFSEHSVFIIEVRAMLDRVYGELRSLLSNIRGDVQHAKSQERDKFSDGSKLELKENRSKQAALVRDIEDTKRKADDARKELASFRKQFVLFGETTKPSSPHPTDSADTPPPPPPMRGLVRMASGAQSQKISNRMGMLRNRMESFKSKSHKSQLGQAYLNDQAAQIRELIDEVEMEVEKWDKSRELHEERLAILRAEESLISARLTTSITTLSPLLESRSIEMTSLITSSDFQLLLAVSSNISVRRHERILNLLGTAVVSSWARPAEEYMEGSHQSKLPSVKASSSFVEHILRRTLHVFGSENSRKLVESELAVVWLSTFILVTFNLNAWEGFKFEFLHSAVQSETALKIVLDTVQANFDARPESVVKRIVLFSGAPSTADPLGAVVVDISGTSSGASDRIFVFSSHVSDSGHVAHNNSHAKWQDDLVKGLRQYYSVTQIRLPQNHFDFANPIFSNESPTTLSSLSLVSSLMTFPFQEHVQGNTAATPLNEDRQALAALVLDVRSRVLDSVAKAVCVTDVGEDLQKSDVDNDDEIMDLVTSVVTASNTISAAISRPPEGELLTPSVVSQQLLKLEDDDCLSPATVARNSTFLQSSKKRFLEHLEHSVIQRSSALSLLNSLRKKWGWSVLPELIFKCKCNSISDSDGDNVVLFDQLQTAIKAVWKIVHFFSQFFISQIGNSGACHRLWVCSLCLNHCSRVTIVFALNT